MWPSFHVIFFSLIITLCFATTLALFLLCNYLALLQTTCFYFILLSTFILTTIHPVPVSKFTGSAGSPTMQHIDIEEDYPIIPTKLWSHSTVQEPMNSTTHWWCHPCYRLNHSTSSIVQDGGDTAINRTVLIYFWTFPDFMSPHPEEISTSGTSW